MTLGEGIVQLYVFAVFWALGVGFCLIYVFGVGLTKTKLAAILFDCIFGAIVVYSVWKVNLEVNNGEFRAFIFVGLVVGCVTAYFTCKSTLDKLSAMLYNLFTTQLEKKSNGTDILQKVDGNNVRSGDTDSGTAGVPVADKPRSNVRTKRAHRNVRKASPRSRSRHERSSGLSRVSQKRRIREVVGRTTRSS